MTLEYKDDMRMLTDKEIHIIDTEYERHKYDTRLLQREEIEAICLKLGCSKVYAAVLAMEIEKAQFDKLNKITGVK